MRMPIRGGLVLAAAVALAACSGNPAASALRHHAPATARPAPAIPVATVPREPPALSSKALCRDESRLAWLDVQRVVAFPEYHFRFGYPAQVAIVSPAKTRLVARALCALPPNKLGPNCLADLGVSFRLSFGPQSLHLATVYVEPMGCGVVRGLGEPERMPTRQFWQVLGVQMGLAKTGAEAMKALQGTLPYLIT
jgi:hypothetical protein